MDPSDKPPSDDFQIRCPRLGHQIFFSYCRQENFGVPCPRTLDCWYPYFPVAHYLGRELDPEVFAACFTRPAKPKILSLVELLEQAQKMGRKG